MSSSFGDTGVERCGTHAVRIFDRLLVRGIGSSTSDDSDVVRQEEDQDHFMARFMEIGAHWSKSPCMRSLLEENKKQDFWNKGR